MAVDVKSFATMLARELAKRGISRELAVKHAVSLVRTFDEEDLREVSAYTTSEDFADLTESLADLIRDKEDEIKSGAGPAPAPKTAPEAPLGDTVRIPVQRPAVPTDKTVAIPVQNPAVPMDKTVAIPIGAPAEDTPVAPSDNMKTRAFRVDTGELPSEHTRRFDGIGPSEIPIKTDTASDITLINLPMVDDYSENQEIYLDDEEEEYEEEAPVVLTKRGKTFFWTITVVAFPIILLAAILVLGVFALGIVAVCAFMAAVFGLVCCEAVAGSGLTLVGIIYGAIEIVSGNVGIGIYEIGLGICCGAVALCLGILTYNFAVRVLPYALKQLITFEGYCLKRVRPMVRRFREECNRL